MVTRVILNNIEISVDMDRTYRTLNILSNSITFNYLQPINTITNKLYTSNNNKYHIDLEKIDKK